MSANEQSLTLAVTLSDADVERIAQRAAEILGERQVEPEVGWLRGAERIAAHIDAPRSRVYALASARRIPVERDGSSLIARRSDLDEWVRAGGGKRP